MAATGQELVTLSQIKAYIDSQKFGEWNSYNQAPTVASAICYLNGTSFKYFTNDNSSSSCSCICYVRCSTDGRKIIVGGRATYDPSGSNLGNLVGTGSKRMYFALKNILEPQCNVSGIKRYDYTGYRVGNEDGVSNGAIDPVEILVSGRNLYLGLGPFEDGTTYMRSWFYCVIVNLDSPTQVVS